MSHIVNIIDLTRTFLRTGEETARQLTWTFTLGDLVASCLFKHPADTEKHNRLFVTLLYYFVTLFYVLPDEFIVWPTLSFLQCNYSGGKYLASAAMVNAPLCSPAALCQLCGAAGNIQWILWWKQLPAASGEVRLDQDHKVMGRRTKTRS